MNQLTINIENSIFSGFNILARVVHSKRGYPRIHFNGHKYGLKEVRQELTVWLCTGSRNKRRCTGSVQTKYINDAMMMKERNPRHLCEGHESSNGIY